MTGPDQASPDRPFNGHTKMLLLAATVLVPLSLLLSTVAAVGGYFTSRDVKEQNDRLEQVVADLEAENLERREASCEQADETRVIQRRMNKDAVLEYGEVIIEVASGADTPPDPAVIAALREVGERRVSAIVNQLPGRRWDPDAQECVDVPIDQGG